jgi:hypothetical protein
VCSSDLNQVRPSASTAAVAHTRIGITALTAGTTAFEPAAPTSTTASRRAPVYFCTPALSGAAVAAVPSVGDVALSAAAAAAAVVTRHTSLTREHTTGGRIAVGSGVTSIAPTRCANEVRLAAAAAATATGDQQPRRQSRRRIGHRNGPYIARTATAT